MSPPTRPGHLLLCIVQGHLLLDKVASKWIRSPPSTKSHLLLDQVTSYLGPTKQGAPYRELLIRGSSRAYNLVLSPGYTRTTSRTTRTTTKIITSPSWWRSWGWCPGGGSGGRSWRWFWCRWGACKVRRPEGEGGGNQFFHLP